jgi:response regulator of citrate/malate metabolism
MYLNAGFADYITKPVEGERLERLIMSYLPAEKLLDTPDSV